MNKENLKPCPNILCNSTEFLELIQLKPLHYYIECGMCNCTTPLFYSSKEEAVEAWNTRPEKPQLALINIIDRLQAVETIMDSNKLNEELKLAFNELESCIEALIEEQEKNDKR